MNDKDMIVRFSACISAGSVLESTTALGQSLYNRPATVGQTFSFDYNGRTLSIPKGKRIRVFFQDKSYEFATGLSVGETFSAALSLYKKDDGSTGFTIWVSEYVDDSWLSDLLNDEAGPESTEPENKPARRGRPRGGVQPPK